MQDYSNSSGESKLWLPRELGPSDIFFSRHPAAPVDRRAPDIDCDDWERRVAEHPRTLLALSGGLYEHRPY